MYEKKLEKLILSAKKNDQNEHSNLNGSRRSITPSTNGESNALNGDGAQKQIPYEKVSIYYLYISVNLHFSSPARVTYGPGNMFILRIRIKSTVG